MNNSYFSDREIGSKPRIKEDITITAWGGIVSLIKSHIEKGSFGVEFPAACPDKHSIIIGTDFQKFSLAIRAEIQDLIWPVDDREVPAKLSILDLIQFCYKNIADPVRERHHPFFDHYHLGFDRVKGQRDFRQKINCILARNGLVYELQEDGQIIRLAPPVLREALQSAIFSTGDSLLDKMLEVARKKYLDPDLTVRKEALVKLWGAWERLKTIEPGEDKKKSTTALLDKCAPEAKFRETLDNEAVELTRIGNTFSIRHSETTQVPLESSEHVDYLFHRLFALIQMILRCK